MSKHVTALWRLVRSGALALSLASVVFSGCGTTGLAFATDDRVEITVPQDRAEVSVPLTVRWRVRDFDLGAGRGSFGIFIDRTPQPPGAPLSWIARDDDTCVASRSCPDEQYLAERGVYSTQRTTFTIDLLPRTVPADVRRREFHEFTIVLLDARGERVGESAWFVQFQLEREES
jgi:hypothetical protein